MLALLVTIHIQPERRDAFLASMLDDARGSVNDEPGCLRFDVLQDSNDPNTIYLYEVYRDQAALDAHGKAPHFIRWRDTVKDWYASPIQVTGCTTIFPPDSGWKKG
jgi:quinol monooxygenase YgiN